MNKDVPHANDLGPGNIGMSALGFLRDARSSLANDLDYFDQRKDKLLITFQIIPVSPRCK
jgi:hypothetical protein